MPCRPHRRRGRRENLAAPDGRKRQLPKVMAGVIFQDGTEVVVRARSPRRLTASVTQNPDNFADNRGA